MKAGHVARGNMDHAGKEYENCISKETELVEEVPGDSEISKNQLYLWEVFFNHKKCIYTKIEKSNMLF